jgi:mono/diheme cytochrome c family protein
MNHYKHLLLWSSLGVLALLIVAAVQENFLKGWRQVQASTRTESGPLDVRLRQVVSPQLRTTDRCVSCHVGMAPGEQYLAGTDLAKPHPPVVHDPAEFGCTVCHGGQGRATDNDDAHGDVHFWPQPMIPLAMADAGCGSCHTHLRVPNVDTLRLGSQLVERNDCLACHRIDGRGGTLRPGGGGMEGPDLSHVGLAGYDREWFAKHLGDHGKAADGPWKTSFGPIPDADRALIDEFLRSRSGAPRLVEAKALFHSLGCRGCHKVGGVGGSDGPDLTLVGDKDPGLLDFSHVPGKPTLAAWFAEHFRDPARIVPGSQMPAFGLSDEQIDQLTRYMLSLRRSDFPEALWPQDRIRAQRFDEREFAADGATLYGTFCAACHGAKGEGLRYPGMTPFPAIANADFLAVASDEFVASTIRQGRPGRRMPAWSGTEGGLLPEEIGALVAHLRHLAGDVPQEPPGHAEPRWVAADPQVGRSFYARFCAGCHGAAGEGLQAPALNNAALLSAATDEYLVETIGRGRRGTEMQGFQTPSPIRPALTDGEIESIVAFVRQWERSSHSPAAAASGEEQTP